MPNVKSVGGLLVMELNGGDYNKELKRGVKSAVFIIPFDAPVATKTPIISSKKAVENTCNDCVFMGVLGKEARFISSMMA